MWSVDTFALCDMKNFPFLSLVRLNVMEKGDTLRWLGFRCSSRDWNTVPVLFIMQSEAVIARSSGVNG